WIIAALLLRISDDARRPAPDPVGELLSTPSGGLPLDEDARNPVAVAGDDQPTEQLRRTSGGGRA
ncbi:MAG TPA: FtsW/RodA/SpoVE family cell cycle protein, partial [Cellulomonas sp.]|nr:FtsW/RodA/SpoVE family cell cycle protein [Cellulomonas sp.]